MERAPRGSTRPRKARREGEGRQVARSAASDEHHPHGFEEPATRTTSPAAGTGLHGQEREQWSFLGGPRQSSRSVMRSRHPCRQDGLRYPPPTGDQRNAPGWVARTSAATLPRMSRKRGNRAGTIGHRNCATRSRSRRSPGRRPILGKASPPPPGARLMLAAAGIRSAARRMLAYSVIHEFTAGWRCETPWPITTAIMAARRSP